MKKASISILKAHLSRYLDVVKSGEEVIVTERGRPVARLSAVDSGGTPTGRTAQLLREGRMRAPTDQGPRQTRIEPVAADPKGRSLELLLEERAEGR
jgi:prevent-host-death family protein